MFWSMIGIVALLTWGLSTGSVTIASGSTTVGGRRAFITSEFSSAYVMTFLVSAFIGFFAAISAGLTILRDEEAKVGEVLHATPLSAREYVWGKALAQVAAFGVGLGLTAASMIFFNHVLPHPGSLEIYGPLGLGNYLRPALIFGLPGLLVSLAIPFYLGNLTRRPVVAFLFPVGMMSLSIFFLWSWSPTWLDPKINQLLMLLEPSGFRWLNETWLKKDLGVDFYNTARVGLDLPFVLSRLAWILVALTAFGATARNFQKSLRGSRAAAPKAGFWRRLLRRRQHPSTAVQPATSPVATPGQAPSQAPALTMTASPPGLWRGVGLFAREEFGRLLHEPALYLFGVIILLQVLGNSLLALGAFQTPLLLTPGLLAVSTTGQLAFMVCLLLMFFTAESLQREQSTGMLAMVYSSPVRGFSLLFGKALGNSLVGVVLVLAVFLGSAIALLVQGTVPLKLTPFLLVWGLLLLPTFLLWTSFVTAIQALTGNRFATYGVAMAVFAYTSYLALTRELDWLTNWPLWGALTWSDMSLLELDRRALLLSRFFALALTVFFLALAVRLFQRRAFDATRILHRLRPAALMRTAWTLLPWALAPLVLGITLYLAVAQGTGGKEAEKDGEDYWKQNLATWRDAKNPSLVAVDLDLDLEPERSWLHSRGTYELLNETEKPLRHFALTGGRHWQEVHWTLEGETYEPEDRSRLYVFTPPFPLEPGAKVTVGFEFEGRYPEGISKAGGGAGNFVLPSGVVLTSFNSAFVPVVGYVESIGVDDDNRYEPKEYADDYYQEQLKPFTGSPSPFTTRVRIKAPAAFRMNSVGILEGEAVADGYRTSEWVSDHPVRFFNVVGARWQVQEGVGTRIFYHPGHPYNVAEMSRVLDAARKYYSEWFYPYPWRELKLSEFPNLAGYAQGFPTNITFSEGIGFLTKHDVKADAVALVTAHEAAHQWWANILTPGDGPGGNILSEGMSHFATMLLLEQINGPRARMEFSKRLEERYLETRRRDAERPLVKIDGSRPGDTTVTYDKGGWVAWMTLQYLGREKTLEGLRGFIEVYKDGPDYPLLEDLTAALRPYAEDPEAYDAFVKQWYHQVVLPEIEVGKAKLESLPEGYRVTVEVRQKGTGDVALEIAATRGERFPDDKPGDKPGDKNEKVKKDGYEEARVSLFLKAGESRTVEILTAFKPEKVVADPDVQLLQFRRAQAVAEL